jgi:hypothetical protein
MLFNLVRTSWYGLRQSYLNDDIDDFTMRVSRLYQAENYVGKVNQ